MDLALNNIQRLICHKTQLTNQPTKNNTLHEQESELIKICFSNMTPFLFSEIQFANGDAF